MPLTSRSETERQRKQGAGINATDVVQSIPVSARLSFAQLWLVAVFIFALMLDARAATNSLRSEAEFRALLDAPLLFVKRHSYTGIHIYDTYYKWPGAAGGIYVLENPSAPRDQWHIRPVIAPDTRETLGAGIYTHPEISWDAKHVIFCFKGEPKGNTAIYEIGIDGRGLRRLTNPSPYCDKYKGAQSGQHDVAPAYLPDGRIVFLSTRPSGLVPCNNTGVAVLHVMNADGSDIHPISVNFVNEFDPTVLPDGRILYGRWEYVDKNALTIQSLWTSLPDGTEETAFYANNMVLPEAILDARPVPNSRQVVGTLAKHNGTPRGSIAFIDPSFGKNAVEAITNLEHPDKPTTDTGDSCEPWPLSDDVVIFSGRPKGTKRNVLEMMDRKSARVELLSDPEICLHSPMLVKPRMRPALIADRINPRAQSGAFLVQDIYQGLPSVKRGEVKSLRVVEETSRVSASTMGASAFNQTFLVSAALAFSTKNFLGVVPVAEDGSAYFEAPAGRAIYLQALDADGRMVQSMRTFVQASPGVTRSCVGCHEHRSTTPATEPQRRTLDDFGGSRVGSVAFRLTPALSLGEREHATRASGNSKSLVSVSDAGSSTAQTSESSSLSGSHQSRESILPLPEGEGRGEGGLRQASPENFAPSARVALALRSPLAQLQPESWGRGYLDYPSMVQPVLDRHCVSCHGGEKGMGGGMDLSGGWTEYFNISYENLVTRRHSQLEAYWIAGIDCMNGTAYWSSQIFEPRKHGSGAAPLAKLLLDGHSGYIPELTRRERDLLMAWIDSNGLYHGTWDSAKTGAAISEWATLRESLMCQMQAAGCASCHTGKDGKPTLFEEDWINLERPEWSRILRAPLGNDPLALGLCRDRKVDTKHQRIRQLVDGYAHAVKPIKDFARREFLAPDRSGAPVTSFASTTNEFYRDMLETITAMRAVVVANPRVDMPGARVVAGEIRQLVPPPNPKALPELRAQRRHGETLLSWDSMANFADYSFELHRGSAKDFAPKQDTLISTLTRTSYVDLSPGGTNWNYALIVVGDAWRSGVIRPSAERPMAAASPQEPGQ